jgi:hypothetical protein
MPSPASAWIITPDSGRIVEFHDMPMRVGRVPFLRVRVALHVESQRILQRMETPVVEEHAARSRIAQRRRLERAAIRLVGRLVRADWPAQPKVEIVGICIRAQFAVTRHAERLERKIRQHRMGAVRARLVDVTRRAVAARRIVKQPFSAQRLRAHVTLPSR